MIKGRFSVVIPTLQRSQDLWPLVDQMAAHPLVHEVLVINNAPEPLSWESAKVRVLPQSENIFVNPAWNLGAREAQAEYLAIVNDDVRFDSHLLDLAAQWLRCPRMGIIGPNSSCFNREGGRAFLRPAYQRPSGFGTLMLMRLDLYRPIPDSLRVFHGDDWLFQHSGRRNWSLWDFPIQTCMSVTSGDARFSPISRADGLAWAALDVRQPRRVALEQRAVAAVRRLLRRSP